MQSVEVRLERCGILNPFWLRARLGVRLDVEAALRRHLARSTRPYNVKLYHDRRPARAPHGQSLPGVKRKEGGAPFVTPTLPAPGVLTCRPPPWRDRPRSSPTNYRLFCLQLSRKIIDGYAAGSLAIR
jgi:hypothetical protein